MYVIITYGMKGIMESAACYKSLKILKSIIEAVQNTTYNIPRRSELVEICAKLASPLALSTFLGKTYAILGSHALSRYQVQHHASIKKQKIAFDESLLKKWTKEGKKKKQSMILANLSSMLEREHKICKIYWVLYLISYGLWIKFQFCCFYLLVIASRLTGIIYTAFCKRCEADLASGALKRRYIFFTFGCTINVFSIKTALIIVKKDIIILVVSKDVQKFQVALE